MTKGLQMAWGGKNNGLNRIKKQLIPLKQVQIWTARKS